LYFERDDHWAYAVIEGTASLTAEVAAVDDANADALVDLYRQLAGEHEDWDDYRAALVRDRRLMVTITPERAYGMWAD
jgi:predicted kinase